MAISFEEFKKIELKVGEIIEADRIEKSEKLIKLTVNLGDENRTIVAGLAGHYQKHDLLGKQVVLVGNLKPRQLMGVESQGMLLAAGDEKPVLISPVNRVENGSILR